MGCHRAFDHAQYSTTRPPYGVISRRLCHVQWTAAPQSECHNDLTFGQLHISMTHSASLFDVVEVQLVFNGQLWFQYVHIMNDTDTLAEE